MSTTIEAIRKQAEVWEAFKGFPDEAVVRADLAAIYLGISKKTLARLRQEGGGPPFIQNIEEGSTARNQIVNYPMGKLRGYRASKEVTSTMNAAQMRGLAFSTMEDLLEEQPYWQHTVFGKSRAGLGSKITKAYPRIIGHIQTVSDEEFASLLHDENAEVVWLSLPDAMKEDWVNPKARAPFHQAYIELLQGWIDQSNAGQEAAVLLDSLN